MKPGESCIETEWEDWAGYGSAGLGTTLITFMAFLCLAVLTWFHIMFLNTGLNDLILVLNKAFIGTVGRVLPISTRIYLADFAVEMSKLECSVAMTAATGPTEAAGVAVGTGEGEAKVEDTVAANLAADAGLDSKLGSRGSSGSKAPPGANSGAAMKRGKSEDLGVGERLPKELLKEMGLGGGDEGSGSDVSQQPAVTNKRSSSGNSKESADDTAVPRKDSAVSAS